MPRSYHRPPSAFRTWFPFSAAALLLGACACPSQTFSIGGTVAGLAGSGLVLQNNAGDDLTITGNGEFSFSTKLEADSAYSVTVKAQPTSPSQTCTVTNPAGTIAKADVTGIAVSCTTNTYSLGGIVDGLAGSGLVLQNNGGDALGVTSDGAFTFPTIVASGASYAVTVRTQPTSPSQTCTVGNGTGTMGGGNVTNLAITCTTNRYSVGGTVGGLAGSGLVLQNNAGDDLGISSNGAFAFSTHIPSGSGYGVTVKAQPTLPSQTCVVANEAGTITDADVTTLAVTCTTNTYSLGGTVSGLAGSGLVLQNGGGDDLSIASDGAFTFNTVVLSGATYAVTVKAQPTSLSQTCTVANGAATMGGGNVTDVTITCTTNSYAVGGTIGGLAGSGLVLQNNAGDDLPVTSNGAFAFAAPILSGSSYSVSVKTQPTSPTQICTVTSGAGTVTSDAITTVSVACITIYSVGGSVSGLTLSGLVLASPGEPDLTVAPGASAFTFATRFPSGSAYDVTVKSQPSALACTVQNGAGTIASSDVTEIAIRCVRLWSAAAAGSGHTIGITVDSTLWDWGYNNYGQLADGTLIWRSAPVEVGTGFTSVAGGLGHTVAVKADGTLWAWGYNNNGQLGDGTTTNRLTPVQIGSGFVSVAAGNYHTLALKADGTLWAWGANAFGQLGNGTTTSRNTPVQVGSGFSSIAAGAFHSAGVKTDGTLWAWGYNAYGQIGDGTSTDRSTPVQIGAGFSSVAAGFNHTVAVKSDGVLWGWGRNATGQVGDGSTSNRLSPVQVGTGFRSAAAGSGHTVALKTDDTLWAWGGNTYGQLGDGTTTNRLTPVQVGSAFSSVGAGEYHTLGVKADGGLWVWGRNNFGQLGDGSSTDRKSPVQIP